VETGTVGTGIKTQCKNKVGIKTKFAIGGENGAVHVYMTEWALTKHWSSVTDNHRKQQTNL